MEEKQEELTNNAEMPTNLVLQAHRIRFGKIFLHMAVALGIVTVSLLLLSVLMPTIAGASKAIVVLFSILAIFILVICTIGIIFLAENNPVSKIFNFVQNFGSSNESIINFSNLCFGLVKYFSIAGIFATIIAIAILSTTKYKGKVGNIILLSAFGICMIISLIVYYLMGGVL